MDEKDSKELSSLNEWIDLLYKTDLFTEEELSSIYETYSYKGFNRDRVIKQLKKTCGDPKLAAEIIIVCALKGPQRAAKTILRNGKSIESFNIPASGAKGTQILSCQRITAATADLAAYYLKRMNAPKRMSIDLPGWLQFPSAGSIILPQSYRDQHIEFSKRFSAIIGGSFNEQIYTQMMQNAYINKSLNLFDESIFVPSSTDNRTSGLKDKKPVKI